MTRFLLPLALTSAASIAQADFPVIEQAQAIPLEGDQWRIEVTLSHPDTGWDHYADGWEVLDQDGTGLGFRELAHPHVHEQPFTRSLTLTLPDGTTRLYIRAQCNVDGLNYTSAHTIDLATPMAPETRPETSSETSPETNPEARP